MTPRGEFANRTDAIDAVVAMCREIAMGGRAVIAVSAVSRQKSSSGNSNYEKLGLASFRGSSELEFSTDDAYVIERTENGDVVARHVKARHGKRTDLHLTFDGEHQSFVPIDGTWQSSSEIQFPGDAA